VERIEIKKQAKLIANANRRLFTRIFIVYFLLLLFLLTIPYICGYNVLFLSFPIHVLIFIPATPYTQAIVKILTTLLSAPVFLLLNQSIYFLLDQKESKLDFYTIKSWIKSKKFLKNSLALGIIICIFTVPFEMAGNILSPYSSISPYTKFQWPWSILIPQFFYIFSAILSFLLSLSYCTANLYPKRSAVWVTIASVKLVLKNLFDYIIFVLSFILWFSIQIVGLLVLSKFTRDYANSYFVCLLSLIFFTPFMMGVGFYFWPYFNICKAIFCKNLMSKHI
jgi:hypothetical protein